MLTTEKNDQTTARKGKRIKESDNIEKFNLREWLLDGGSDAGIREALLVPDVASGDTLVSGEMAGDSAVLIGTVFVPSSL